MDPSQDPAAPAPVDPGVPTTPPAGDPAPVDPGVTTPDDAPATDEPAAPAADGGDATPTV